MTQNFYKFLWNQLQIYLILKKEKNPTIYVLCAQLKEIPDILLVNSIDNDDSEDSEVNDSNSSSMNDGNNSSSMNDENSRNNQR